MFQFRLCYLSLLVIYCSNCFGDNSTKYEITYPFTATLTGDLIHVLPTVQVIPPIKKEVFTNNKHHLIKLSELEARYLAKTQYKFLEYMHPFISIHQESMLAYKRTLHVALTSFSMKLLIFILTIDKTFERYNHIFANSPLKQRFDKTVEQFNKNMKQVDMCFLSMRIGFNPGNWSFDTVTISQREFRFVFEKFMHRSTDNIPLAYSCSFIAQELIMSFTLLMSQLFIPISKVLAKTFDESPMKLIKMVDVKEIQIGRIDNINGALNKTFQIIKEEYNFWHELQTNDNPSLYYMVMRQLEGVMKFRSYVPNLVRKKIREYPIKCHKQLELILDDINEFVIKLDKEYEDRGVRNFTTKLSFSSTDEIEEFYFEHVSTEVRLISYILMPIHIFATKFIFIHVYSKRCNHPLTNVLYLMKNDPFIERLMKIPVSYIDYPSVLIVHGTPVDRQITDLPLTSALKLNIKQPSTIEKYSESERKNTPTKKDVTETLNTLWMHTHEAFSHYGTKQLKSKPSFDVLMERNVHRERPIVRHITPPIYKEKAIEWPLLSKEDESFDKTKESFHLFHTRNAYEHLLQINDG
ncbi:hypothetical protein SNEBB_008780 [Seison nebaliae]|nr:hypothetical protein SNEBB_008780 [Seison nebaliae]